MEKTNKKYVITKDNFCGKKGEILEINWDAYDGAFWKNLNTGKCGNPFAETDCIKEVIE